MLTYAKRLGFMIWLSLNLFAVTSHAQTPNYRYVSLDQIALPTGFSTFYPTAIQDSGRVYGTLCDATCSVPHLAFFKDGALTVSPPLPPGSFSGPVNSQGVVGGSVLTDPVNFIVHAALFRGDKVEFVPPQPGEVFAFVFSINDSGTALVESDDVSGKPTFVLYRNGKASPINFGSNVTNPFFTFIGNSKSINNHDIIAGTEGNSLFNGARGFRFDARKGIATLLNPFPGDQTETLSWGQAINERGDVLGYSFVVTPPYHERIGVWSQNGVFQTFLVETESSNRLLFNDNNLIVITAVFSSHKSYLVPKPDVRLDLSTLVGNLPPGEDLFSITGLNNRGDMIGSSSAGRNFLLQSVDPSEPLEAVAEATKHSRPIAPWVQAILNRRNPRLNELK